MSRSHPQPITFRTTDETLLAVDAAAEKAGVTRAAMLDHLVVAGLAKVNLKAIAAEHRAARKSAVGLRAHLLKAMHDALATWEDGD